jgi:hypothetical protein
MQSVWFTKKDYGYGWVPCSWQGVLVMLAYMALQVGAALYVAVAPEAPHLPLVGVWIATWTLTLFAICRAHTGDQPSV